MRTHHLLVLLVFALLLTLSAVVVQPVWDDAWLRMLLESGGAVRPYMQDRPLVGALWQWLADHGVLWGSAYLLHFLAWAAIGIVAWQLWILLFPDLHRHSGAVACLAVSPILCENQLLIATTMLTSQVPVVIVFAALLLTVHASRSRLAASVKVVLYVCAGGLVLIATQLSEYAVAAAFGATVVLAYLTGRRSSIRQACLTCTAALSPALLGYVIYWATSDPQTRAAVRPELSFSPAALLNRSIGTVVRLFNDTWSLSIGRTASALAGVRVEPTFAGTIVGTPLLVLALLAGTALALGTRAPAPTTGDGHPQPSKGKAEAVLLLALVGGLLPVALMGVSGSDGGMETRLWLPVLPIAACLSYAVLVRVATPRRAWMGAFVVGFLAVQSTAHLVERAVWIRNRANVWGAQLRSSLAPEGMTVAVFVSDDARWNGMADYELTARLTRSWTREERDRFWALPRMADIRYLEGTRVASDVVPPAKVLSYVRGLVRKGTLSRFILVAVEPDGSIRFRSHDAAARAGS